MAQQGQRLTADAVAHLLTGGRVYVFDPQTRERVAHVDYRPDHSCHAVFASGDEDQGQWGLKGDTYWTCYTRFRGGAVSEFYLERVADGVAQAYHSDGRMAFLQSHQSVLAE